MRKIIGLAAGLALSAGIAWAGVPVEQNALNGVKVKLHVYPFLDATELMTLRFAMTNQQGLTLLLPDSGTGFAAIALAPDEGMVRGGKLVDSVGALKGFPDAKTAQEQSLAACEAKRAPSGQACVIVLEVGPN